MSHGVLPSQIRTRDSGRCSASAITSGGGANGQPARLSIGYSGIAASVVILVSVSDILLIPRYVWPAPDRRPRHGGRAPTSLPGGLRWVGGQQRRPLAGRETLR